MVPASSILKIILLKRLSVVIKLIEKVKLEILGGGKWENIMLLNIFCEEGWEAKLSKLWVVLNSGSV